jgi:hypothetical protein
VLAAVAQPGQNPLARILHSRPLVGLGLISYGVYLWHWPISIWVTSQNTGVGGVALFFVRSTVTLAAALASYFLVEQPIRQGRLPGSFLKNRGVVPMGLVTAVAVVLLIPAIAFPSVASVPTAGPSSASAIAVTARYAKAPRCDDHASAPRLKPSYSPRVELFGNSISEEIGACLGKILRVRGATLEGLSPDAFFLCSTIPKVQASVRNPATRPVAAIFFALVATDPSCGPSSKWYTPVQKLISIWENAGVHVYLVPSVPPVTRSAQANVLAPPSLDEASYYQMLATQDPVHITVLDAGTFLRTDVGQYPWRMPCLPNEPGCDKHHTVGVRWTDGFHYCTDPNFAAGGCPQIVNQAGEHRAAAAVAAGLLPWLQVSKSTPARSST